MSLLLKRICPFYLRVMYKLLFYLFLTFIYLLIKSNLNYLPNDYNLNIKLLYFPF